MAWSRPAILALLLLITSAKTASAQYTPGANLSWSDCGASGALDMTFACDRNTGSNELVVSFVAPATADSVVGGSCVWDIKTGTTAYLEPWWQLYSGGCRPGGIVRFSEAYYGATCNDLWQGNSANGLVTTTRELLGYTTRIRTSISLPAGVPIVADQEYFFAYLSISHNRTVNYLSCDGCTAKTCIALNEIQLAEAASEGPGWSLGGVKPGGRDYVTWQAAGAPDCAALPAVKRTWGQIKELYR